MWFLLACSNQPPQLLAIDGFDVPRAGRFVTLDVEVDHPQSFAFEAVDPDGDLVVFWWLRLPFAWSPVEQGLHFDGTAEVGEATATLILEGREPGAPASQDGNVYTVYELILRVF